MKTAKSSVGLKFGRLTVISIAHRDADRSWHVLCVCDCGNEKVVKFSRLSSGNLQSCGCLTKESARVNAIQGCTTHGLTGSPTYRSWASMINRCSNHSGNRSHIYSGAGVTVCVRWRSFEAFLSDMGERPTGMTLDRYPDQNGNYEPSNCRWATPREQALNRRTTRWFEYDGLRLSLKDLAGHIGMKRLTLLQRLKRGWSLDAAIKTPVRTDSRHRKTEEISETVADNIITL